MGVVYIAAKRLKVGDRMVEPGEEVHMDRGRNYNMMVRLGQVTVVPKRGPGRPRKAENDE